MKYLLVIVSLLASVFLGTHSHAVQSKMVDITPQRVFAPVGFDDNDEIVAVIDGYLPDTCYRLRQPTIQKDIANRVIVVQPKAELFAEICNDVTVPFFTVVNLGPLPQGEYRIVSQDGTLWEKVTIRRSTGPGPDDYLYAPIDSTEVVPDSTGKYTAVVRGRFTSACLEIAEMRLINSGKTLELLPIMTKLEGVQCQKAESPFEKRVYLPRLTPGRYLLHVRSLNGQAVNQVFSIYGHAAE